ncbi:hypothetical protein ACFX13_005348 [Malus domestica]
MLLQNVYAFGVVLCELISAKEAVVRTNEYVAESKGLVDLFENVLNRPDPREDLAMQRWLFGWHNLRKLAHKKPSNETEHEIDCGCADDTYITSSKDDWDVRSFYESEADLVNLMSGK